VQSTARPKKHKHRCKALCKHGVSRALTTYPLTYRALHRAVCGFLKSLVLRSACGTVRKPAIVCYCPRLYIALTWEPLLCTLFLRVPGPLVDGANVCFRRQCQPNPKRPWSASPACPNSTRQQLSRLIRSCPFTPSRVRPPRPSPSLSAAHNSTGQRQRTLDFRPKLRVPLGSFLWTTGGAIILQPARDPAAATAP
jgi:hypothetical protein